MRASSRASSSARRSFSSSRRWSSRSPIRPTDSSRRARASRVWLCSSSIWRRQVGQLAASTFSARARGGFQLAAMALQLASQFGLAAMRVVQLALRVVARAFGLELAGAQVVQPVAGVLQLRFQRGDLLDAAAQISRSRASTPTCCPARGAHAPSPAPSHSPSRVITDSLRRQARQRRTRVPSSSVSAVSTWPRIASAAAGPRDLRGQRSRRRWRRRRRHRASARSAFAEVRRIRSASARAFDQHAVEQAGQRGFHGVFPAGFDLQRFAEARGASSPRASASRWRRSVPDRARRAAALPATTAGRVRPAPACAPRSARTAPGALRSSSFVVAGLVLVEQAAAGVSSARAGSSCSSMQLLGRRRRSAATSAALLFRRPAPRGGATGRCAWRSR